MGSAADIEERLDQAERLFGVTFLPWQRDYLVSWLAAGRATRRQCKHIDDATFLRAVDVAATARGLSMASRWDVAAVLVGRVEDIGQRPVDYAEMPERLVRAKARKLIRRGLLEGCWCGCRGDLAVADLRVPRG